MDANGVLSMDGNQTPATLSLKYEPGSTETIEIFTADWNPTPHACVNGKVLGLIHVYEVEYHILHQLAEIFKNFFMLNFESIN